MPNTAFRGRSKLLGEQAPTMARYQCHYTEGGASLDFLGLKGSSSAHLGPVRHSLVALAHANEGHDSGGGTRRYEKTPESAGTPCHLTMKRTRGQVITRVTGLEEGLLPVAKEMPRLS